MGFKARPTPVSMEGDNPFDTKRRAGGTRHIYAPLEARHLKPFGPECVMVEVCDVLSPEELGKINRLIAGDPSKWFNPHWRAEGDWVPSLDFLEHTPDIERLYLPHHSGPDIEAIRHVPKLTHLRLDKYKHRLSLRPLEDLRRLAWVQLDGHKHAEVLCGLPNLQCASLIKLDLGKRFTGLPKVTDAVIVQCKFSVLPPMPRVERLRVSYGKPEDGLASLGSLSRLERLSITCIKTLDQLPELAALPRLRHLRLYDLRGLRSIEAVARMSSLTSLSISDVPLSAAALECLRGHPSLRSVKIELTDDAETNRAKQSLGLELTGLRLASDGVRLIEDEPGHYVVSLTDTQSSWDVFEDVGHLANGHTWARLVEATMAKWPPKWKRATTLDPEADGFHAQTTQVRAARWIYNHLVRLSKSDEGLRAALTELG